MKVDAGQEVANVVHAALHEVGRDDLADGCLVFVDEDGPYVEFNDEVINEGDWALIDKAETIGRNAIGMGARHRPNVA